MNLKNKHIILLFLLIVFSKAALIADNDSLAVHYDKTKVDLRLPDKSGIEDYKNNSAYQYDTEPAPPESFWDKIWYKIREIIDWVFNESPLGSFIAWTVISIVVLLIIMRLLKTPLKNLFIGSKYDRDISVQEIDEDATEDQIEERIKECLQSKQYRLATRLLYIKLLKKLSNHKIISWQIDKTNNDYRIELINTKYTSQFNKLSSLYDYVWYGNFKIEEQLFLDVNDQYNKFFTELDEE